MNAIAAALSPMTPPQPGPQNARGDEARGDEFSRCLDQACESEPPERPEASDAPQRPATKASRGRDATASRKAEANTAKEVPPKSQNADAAADSESAAASAEAPRDEAAAPDLAALLPGWSPPATVVASTTASAAAAPADGPDALATAASGVAPASPSMRNDALPRAATPPETPPARSAAQASDSSPTGTAPSSAQLQAAASEQKDTALGSQAGATSIPTTVAFASPSTTLAATAARAAEAALPTATVQAPIDTPTFAPSLATQVRWWANDGVQQAQLLLNPAEMGPVAVKIVIDGREARIDFSADLAATRSAIEGALPALAAALDDSGLKLSGGGVHDGSAQRQPAWSAHSVTDRTAATAATRGDERAANAAAPRLGPGRGIVDLVA